ncbi:hypothetical protein FQZ97_993730 [compost metagenome]
MLGFGGAVQRGAAGLGHQGLALPLHFAQRGFGFAQPAALVGQVRLLLDAHLLALQVAVARDEVLLHQFLEILCALLGNGQRLLQLAHQRLGGAQLGLAPCGVGGDAAQTRCVFGVLPSQQAFGLQVARVVHTGGSG